jgi:hypothetical protein
VTHTNKLALLRREPVRVYLYGVYAAVLLLLLAYGVITTELLPLWLGLGAALLAVPAVEGARAKVTPYHGVAALQRPDGAIVAGPAAPGTTKPGTPVEVLRPADTDHW